jgi:hypothetical protein
VKKLAENLGLIALGLIVPALTIGIAVLVLSIKWRHDACNAQGATPAKTDAGRIVCVHPDGTVSQP